MNITKNRKTWFSLSAGLMIASIVAVLTLGLNFGLDFTGGARWNVAFTAEELVTQQQLAEFFEARPEITQNVKIQEVEIDAADTASLTMEYDTADENGENAQNNAVMQNKSQFLLTVQDLDETLNQKMQADLQAKFGVYETISYRKVASSVGQSFKKKSLYAVVLALVGIILFVAFAFRMVPEFIGKWRFGGVAIAALFHDVIILLGVFAVLGFVADVEIDLTFITAMLATLGFSVNDTIVILDRVRENLRKVKAHETFEDTVEKSVEQTLARSVNTSVSTLLPLLGLLFFGADAIFYFVLALVVGIVVGTYSSIFLAAPMLAEWKLRIDSK
jgi:preprotein translocase subunit SecF